MAQIIFGPDTTPQNGDLDANFGENYGVSNYFKTPGYTGASWKIQIAADGKVGFGKVPAQNVDIQLMRGYVATEEASGGIAWRRQAIAGYGSYDLYGADTNTGTWIAGRQPGNNAGYAWATGDFTAWTLRMLLDVNGNLVLGRSGQQSGGKFEVSGNVVLQPAGAAPTLANNGDMSFQLVSNTSLKILVRGSDGVTRSTTLTLA